MTLFSTNEHGQPEHPVKVRKSAKERRRSLGITLLTGSLVLTLALAAVPSAYVIEEPGPWFDTLGYVSVPSDDDGDKDLKTKIPLISIEDEATFPTTGKLDLLTVTVRGNPESTPTWLEVAMAWFEPSKAVVPLEAIFSPNETNEERDAANTALMVNSQQDAIAAALTNLGYDVVVGVKVMGFADGSPAQGVLQEGDIITAFNGTDVESVPELRALLDENGTSIPGTVTYLRDGVSYDAQITPMASESGAVLGVAAQLEYNFPIDVKIRLDDVGGPSAGMMFALGIIDKLTPDDMTAGYHFAGTGTIDAAGKVGPIGGIRQKLYGAQKSGATYFLAPAANCGDVIGHIPDGLQVFSVETLEDAIDVVNFVAMHGEDSQAMNDKMGMLSTCQNE